MKDIKVIEGNFTSAKDKKFAIVATRWNSFVVGSLVEGAIDYLVRHGVDKDDLTLIYCPGAFEIPLTVKKLAAKQQFDAIIALGAVIRGGTPHFDFVAGECVKGLSVVNLDAEIPVSFGVLTVDSIEQAVERAGTKMGNKGEEAAASALEMVSLLDSI